MMKRIKDLKVGDEFMMLNIKFVVTKITDRIYYSYKTKNGSTGSRVSFGLNNSARVEVIKNG